MCNLRSKGPSRRAVLSTLISSAALAPLAFSEDKVDMAEQFRRVSESFEREGLAEPFKGITTSGQLERLFQGRARLSVTVQILLGQGKIHQAGGVVGMTHGRRGCPPRPV